MSDRFDNISVLITGATSGIGRTTALEFAQRGAAVTVTGRRQNLGDELVSQITSAGGKAHFVQGDVTDEDHIKAAVAAAVEHFGGLHVAVNNAAVELGGPVTEVTAEDIDKVLSINVKGLLLSMKHEIAAILKTIGGQPGGSIINVSSGAGHIGMAGASVYVASKHAVLGATKSAALEVATQGIRVNAVSPGGVETEMLDRFTGGDHDILRDLHPMGRLGQPREIADAILWLASGQSSFVTGQSILVDGGFSVP